MLGEFCKRYRIVGSGVHDHDTGPLDSEGYHFPPLRSAFSHGQFKGRPFLIPCTMIPCTMGASCVDF